MAVTFTICFYDRQGESIHRNVPNLYNNPDVFNQNNNNKSTKLYIADTKISKNSDHQQSTHEFANKTNGNNNVINFKHNSTYSKELFPLPVGSFFIVSKEQHLNTQFLHIIGYENKYLRNYSIDKLGYLINVILDLFHPGYTDIISDKSEQTKIELYMKNKYTAVDAYLPVSMRLKEISDFLRYFDNNRYEIELV